MRDDAPFDTPLPFRACPNGLQDQQDDKTLTLRILATTDLHVQLSGFDYVNDQQTTHHGLAGLADLIETARSEAKGRGDVCLLLDNGDLLQGGPLGRMLAKRKIDQTHPVVSILNQLGYDAIGLGNHDFDYGLEYVTALAKHLHMPVIASNLDLLESAGLQSAGLLRPVNPQTNKPLPVQIGLVSVLPEHTAIWNAHVLQGKAQVRPATESLRRIVPRLRAQGADIVILLAHMGIEDGAIDNAQALAKHAGADALIMGHTHRRFPGVDHTEAPGVDIRSGLIESRPAVMPGHNASDLAVMDLVLCGSEKGRWHIESHQTTLVPNTVKLTASPAVLSLCRREHETLRKELSTPVAHTATPLHTFFGLAMPTAIGTLLAQAKARVIQTEIAGTPEAILPLLATTSAHNAGGLAGPSNYINIPSGPLLRRHVAGLTPYANQIWGVKVSGGMVKHWLEVAAQIFHPIAKSDDNQPLINLDVPPFNFDTIYGVKYRIDPSKRAGARIADLTHNGAPIQADQHFVLATSHFRASGSGGFLSASAAEVVHRSKTSLESALIDALQSSGPSYWQHQSPWRLSCSTPTKAVLETSPYALAHLDEIAHLSPKPLGRASSGFARIRVTV